MNLKRKDVLCKEIEQLESKKLKLKNEAIGKITGPTMCSILIFGY